MKVLKKIIQTIIILFLVLIVAYNIYNIINTKILKNRLTTVNGYAMLEVVSGSMEPTIKVGDLIIINTKEKEYKKNDIVTFYDVNDVFVTHRIVSINKEEMITKGDNNSSKDEATKRTKIVGKYVRKIPYFGTILASFRSPITLSLILIIGILVCYLISTDKEGNPIDEEEFEEFKKEKEEEEIDYSKMTVKELKMLAKERNIKGYSKLKKQELIEILKQ